MSEGKKSKQKQNLKSKDKKHVSPSDIQGKIEVPDTRERRDGPGGN
ncbi:MAG: hypothetical protein IJZ90_00635 [Clostridia bacterium]|nr:hypothetical protein [Clostridia bacterium]